MGALEIVITAAVGLLLVLILIYLLILIRPRRRGIRPDSALLCDYAHRGLHGDGVPENSLRAFALACERGVGIELDVQLSRDGEVMVFHDATLNRMTGRDARVCDLDAAELTTLSLAGSEETIPTFRQVLELVDGRVPLLVELKGESFDTALCPKVAALLSAYHGAYCIESFNPLLVRGMHQQLPEVVGGLLYTNVCRDKKKYSFLNVALTLMALNVLARPDFIAYNQVDRRSLPVRLTTRLYRAPRFAWTVRDDHALEEARQNRECPIFESIAPPKQD